MVGGGKKKRQTHNNNKKKLMICALIATPEATKVRCTDAYQLSTNPVICIIACMHLYTFSTHRPSVFRFLILLSKIETKKACFFSQGTHR